MLSRLAEATILDVVIKVLSNGPDDPSPKVSHELYHICDNKPTPGKFDLPTYDVCLEWFEERNLFTYEDLVRWMERHLFTLPPL